MLQGPLKPDSITDSASLGPSPRKLPPPSGRKLSGSTGRRGAPGLSSPGGLYSSPKSQHLSNQQAFPTPLRVLRLHPEFPSWHSGSRTRLGTMRLRVRFLALLRGLRIWCCRELWCGLQTRLGSCVAVALVQAGSYNSDWTPYLGTSMCCRSGSRKGKKTKRKKKKGNLYQVREHTRSVTGIRS